MAWEQVWRYRGATGVDGKTIESIEVNGTLRFLLELREVLIKESYRPHPGIPTQTECQAKRFTTFENG